MKNKSVPSSILYGQPKQSRFNIYTLTTTLGFLLFGAVAIIFGMMEQADTGAINQLRATAYDALADGNIDVAGEIALQLADYGELDHRLIANIAAAPGEFMRLEGHNEEVKAVSVSYDGRYAVSSAGEVGYAESADMSIIIWDLTSGELVQQCEGHTDSVMSVAFHPDDYTILSGSRDGTMRLWEWTANSCDTLQTFESTGDPRHEIDRTNLMSNTELIYIWDVAFTPDGDQVMSAANDGTMILWDAETGEPLQHFVDELFEGVDRYWVNTLAISPSGDYVVSGSDDILSDGSDTTLVVIHALTSDDNVVDGDMSLVGHRNNVISVAINPVDENYVLTASRDGSVRYWDLTTGEVAISASGVPSTYSIDRSQAHFQSVAISPNGRYAVFGTGYFYDDATVNEIIVWDLVNWHEVARFDAHDSGIWDMAFLPSGNQVVSASADGSVMVWNLFTTATTGMSDDELLDIVALRYGD